MAAKNAKSRAGKTVKKSSSSRGAKAKRSGNVVPPTRATGSESATGTALNQAHKEIPKGEKRGSTVPIVGGEPKPDADGPQKLSEAQKAPARFTSNGQIEENTVASPSGPVPVAVVARDQDHADELLEAKDKAHQDFIERRTSAKALDEHTINRLSRPELHAIGQQRGYELNETVGTRATRAAFLEAQRKDKNLTKA
jgi:hypothetical protein